MCVSILYLCFSFWLTSLCIIGSSFIHLIVLLHCHKGRGCHNCLQFLNFYFLFFPYYSFLPSLLSFSFPLFILASPSCFLFLPFPETLSDYISLWKDLICWRNSIIYLKIHVIRNWKCLITFKILNKITPGKAH